MNRGEVLRLACVAAVSAMIGGLVFFVGTTLVTKPEAATDLGYGPSVTAVNTKYGPAVVSVDAGSSGGTTGSGSGFVLDQDGHVVTSQHVLEGAQDVMVRFSDGTRDEAEIVGQDPSTDLAVLRVDTAEVALRPLKLGDSDTADVGEAVLAVGNPLDLGISLSTGIVSGTGRLIKSPDGSTIGGAFQTDAALNPGSSGGPLLDSRGTVIGMNSQIASSTGSFQGVSFAIPINTVRSAAEQLISTGEVAHAYAGMETYSTGIEAISAYSDDLAGTLSGEYGLPENGAIVESVAEGGPAYKAGIRGGEPKRVGNLPVPVPTGDIVTEIEGKRVSHPDDVEAIVNSLKPGDKLKLTAVTPGQKPRRVELRLDAEPQEP